MCFAAIQIKAQDGDTINYDKSLIAADTAITDTTIQKSSSLKIVFAGDIMGHDAQIEGAWVDSIKKFNYEPTFSHIADYISAADIAVGNLEVTLAGPPYKGYPQFSSPDELAIAAKNAGFDIMVMANNHALDRGTPGFKRTLNVLDSLEILHTGTFLNDSIRNLFYPLIVEQNNIRLAILNYTYGTNGLKIPSPYIINRIDTALIRKDLQKAMLAHPDITIVTIHWGIEYERNENKTQQVLAHFILNNGADAIIGSHPHVIQPIKNVIYNTNDSGNTRPVFYSLGNFVSNQRAQFKDGGIVAELVLSKNDSTTRIDSVAYLPYWVYREDENEKSTFYVLPVQKYENDTSLFDFDDNNKWRFNRFVNDTRTHLSGFSESNFYTIKKSEGIKNE